MLTSLPLFLVWLIGFVSTVKALAISLPPSITAGTSVNVSWIRNSPSDPSQFTLRLRDLSKGDSNGETTSVDSEGNKEGTRLLDFPSKGAFLIEAYPDNALTKVLASSSTVNVAAARSAKKSKPEASPPRPGSPDPLKPQRGEDKEPEPLGRPNPPEPPPPPSPSTLNNLATVTVVASESTTQPLDEFPVTSATQPTRPDTDGGAEATPLPDEDEGEPLPSPTAFSTISTRSSSPPTSNTNTTNTPIAAGAISNSQPMPPNLKAAIIVSSIFGVVFILMIILLLTIWRRRKSKRSENDIESFGRETAKSFMGAASLRSSMAYFVRTEIPGQRTPVNMTEEERTARNLTALRQLQAPKAKKGQGIV